MRTSLLMISDILSWITSIFIVENVVHVYSISFWRYGAVLFF
jgi:hypothetical protein